MKRTIIPYNPDLVEIARKRRNKSSKTEIKLWYFLKDKRMKGYEFHRQKPLLNYIADFFCHELLLVIELEGNSHFPDKDITQEKDFENIGLTVLRFSRDAIFKETNTVLKTIETTIEEIENKKKPQKKK
ncbi:MAG: DNA methylase [Flammeovirgaceae bacterium]|nr:DNA methylase [Flammeovirgaceae bacterium]MBE62954.1 DNA methylase [Flammeovirgaceae bacterium]MBR08812.1 DNA methylase [Rickettsiales bacterium]HCX20797.1 DNA methylase [Cytophagales bacterium]